MELSRRARSVAPSATLSIDTKAKAFRAEGKDVVCFGVGEPDFDTPVFIREAAKKAMDEGKTRYTPVAGTLSLRQAICDKLNTENGTTYTPQQIVVSDGAKHSLYNTFQVLLNPEDEVIIPSPCWVSYPELVRLAGGTPVIVHAEEEDGFLPQITAIRAAVTRHTKAIVICNPCNPTGAVYPRQLLEQIAEIAVENDFFVVADEIYDKLVYNGIQYVSFVSLGDSVRDHTILVNGASKTYAMTGWRVGYTASSREIASLMSTIQSQETSCANSIAQYALEAALKGQDQEVRFMNCEFDQRRISLCEGINAINGLSCRYPDGAFYVLINISECIGRRFRGTVINGSETFAEKLLDSYHVALVPGRSFGTDRHVRISYAVDSETIRKGLERLEAFVKELE